MVQLRQYLGSFSIALIYFIAGALWILYSDQWAASIAADMDQLALIQTWKGWFYVFMTAVPLYLLIKIHQQYLIDSGDLLARTERRYERVFAGNPYPMLIVLPPPA